MNLSDLTPNPQNPRKITEEQKDLLKKSMEQFGDLSGIVFNKKTGHLICGHQRVEALKEIGINNFEVDSKGRGSVNLLGEVFQYREVEWDEDKEKLAMIRANKAAGDWDFNLLSDMMLDLDSGDIDMELTGFNELEREEVIVHDRKERKFGVFVICEDEDSERDTAEKLIALGYKCRK